MARSPLFGRRVHISGSISVDPAVASAADVQSARQLVGELVAKLIELGATFVLPVDAEKPRPSDGLPICFDWLIWQTINANLAKRPYGAPDPLAVAVEHHKNEDQVPEAFQSLWDGLRGTDRVQIENVSHWNMNGKRLETQARWGDILITLGGGEGVLFLANLYHDAGKPVVPLNLPVVAGDQGSRRLSTMGLSSTLAPKLFRANSQTAHTWMNRIQFASRVTTAERVTKLIALLEDLEPPKAFVVRLLDPSHADYSDVDAFFEGVVKPVIEADLGYKAVMVDGRQAFEHPRVDQEIFARLHRSALVIADITGSRPNCFLELGYGLGRQLPVMVTARQGATHPFDITTLGAHHWKTTISLADRRRELLEHWEAVRRRPPLVPTEPLVS